MDQLYSLIGREHEIADVCRELKFWVHRSGASVVGAMNVTCADESAHEGAELFHRAFAQEMLPRLKYGNRAPFRLASPGSRYDWGSIRVAEANFATAETPGSFKALVVKISSHVSVERSGQGLSFGTMRRYGADSHFCGALAALLDGGTASFLHELRETFQSEGLDRLTILLDPARVEPGLRLLYAAVVNARLQARSAALDIQDFEPRSPTFYLVVHGVILNRQGADSELVGGIYAIDRTGQRRSDRYCGLGSDPSAYRLSMESGSIVLVDDHFERPRDARDHRHLARERLRVLDPPPHRQQELIRGIVSDVRRSGEIGPYKKALVKTLIAALIEVAPVPAALVLLGEGLLEIRHAHRLDQAARHETETHRAQGALHDLLLRIDHLPDEQVRTLTDTLIARLEAARDATSRHDTT